MKSHALDFLTLHAPVGKQIAGLRDVRQAFDSQQIIEGVRQLVHSITPASDGRVQLLQVLLQPRRIFEVLPALLLMLGALGGCAALAWSTESLLGVSRSVCVCVRVCVCVCVYACMRVCVFVCVRVRVPV